MRCINRSYVPLAPQYSLIYPHTCTACCPSPDLAISLWSFSLFPDLSSLNKPITCICYHLIPIPLPSSSNTYKWHLQCFYIAKKSAQSNAANTNFNFNNLIRCLWSVSEHPSLVPGGELSTENHIITTFRYEFKDRHHDTESNYGQSLKTLLQVVISPAPILWLLRRFYLQGHFLTYKNAPEQLLEVTWVTTSL